MRKIDLYPLKGAIEACIEKLDGSKFNYGLNKNLDLIEKELEIIKKAEPEPSEALKAYRQAEKQLIESKAKKDTAGNFVLKNLKEDGTGEYDFDDISDVSKQIITLAEAHPEAIAEQKKANEDFKALLDEELDIQLFKIKLDNVPANIPGYLFKGITALIEE